MSDTTKAQPCSPELALRMFQQLQYYRNFMPFCVGMTEAQYAATSEAKGADAIIAAYVAETGEALDEKPS